MSAEPYPVQLLRRLLRDLPMYECNDFHHGKADQHEGFDCPVFKRFRAAEIEATAYLDGLQK